MGESRVRSEQVQKISPPPGLELRTLQHEGSCYTFYAIPAATIFRAAEEECTASKFAGKGEHWKLKNVRRWEVDCNSIQRRNGKIGRFC
jgi:hypothetical protein